jgi:thiaminase/transcriptional activator TenA
VSVAALLPCFWIYWEVGSHLLAIARPDNPYQAWIDTYADEAFAQGVRKVIAISDRVAADATPAVRAQMLKAFVRASQLEWMFWDSAWRREAWPV